RLVSSSLNPDEVLANLARAISQFFDAPYVSVWGLDAATGRLRRTLTHGDPALAAELHDTLAPGEGGIGWVVQHREPIFWTEVAEILNAPLDARQVLKRLAIKVAQVCGVDRCSIERWEGDRGVPLMSQFADGRKVPAMWDRFLSVTKRPLREVPVNARAIETRRPVIVEDAGDASLTPPDWVEAFGLQSYTWVPTCSTSARSGSSPSAAITCPGTCCRSSSSGPSCSATFRGSSKAGGRGARCGAATCRTIRASIAAGSRTCPRTPCCSCPPSRAASRSAASSSYGGTPGACSSRPRSGWWRAWPRRSASPWRTPTSRVSRR